MSTRQGWPFQQTGNCGRLFGCDMRIQDFPVLLLAMTLSFAARGAAAAAAPVESKTPATDPIDWTKAREFWSFRPPSLKARPVVKNRRWPRQPLDYFVLARLEQTNLVPARQADERTLVRRVTFDLTGLPPTPSEVAA